MQNGGALAELKQANNNCHGRAIAWKICWSRKHDNLFKLQCVFTETIFCTVTLATVSICIPTMKNERARMILEGQFLLTDDDNVN